jgi:hypothetical protein
MTIKLQKHENFAGDKNVADQGYGRVATSHPPTFDPIEQIGDAYAHFESTGFALLDACLDADDLAHLNEFCDRTQVERRDRWGLGEKRKPHHRGRGSSTASPCSTIPSSIGIRSIRAPTRSSLRFSAAKIARASPSSTYARRPRTRATAG